ncbi:response regulator [Alteromonas oceanisediminis]|uniref:response regulator n=1 Tax=Alteromonas oceanisediminis TaxID=2836180 RepID=UPI002023B174|nr:response regulator [Alteromonas oceanisediminis]
MSDSEVRSLTTGEIAKYCGVNLRTVIRWLDAGKLKGYKLPGRGNNRVLLPDFIRFLKAHDLPIPPELNKSENPLVLIVDDELSMAKAIQRVARKAGLRTLIATGGFQAGLMLSMHKPDIMTLDLSMPGLNGFDVIRHTRQQDSLQHVNILVISALAQDKLDEALSLGATKIYTKPFDQAQLLTEFENATR